MPDNENNTQTASVKAGETTIIKMDSEVPKDTKCRADEDDVTSIKEEVVKKPSAECIEMKLEETVAKTSPGKTKPNVELLNKEDKTDDAKEPKTTGSVKIPKKKKVPTATLR